MSEYDRRRRRPARPRAARDVMAAGAYTGFGFHFCRVSAEQVEDISAAG